MKEIPLTQGKVALVDDEDFEYLNQWKWCAVKGKSTYYCERGLYAGKKNGKKVVKIFLMHRIIMNPPNNLVIDHINHNGLDNRKENLRICSQRVNTMNRLKINPDQLCGAFKNGSGYFARIKIGNKYKYLGQFRNRIDAHNRYMQEYELLKTQIIQQ